MSTILDISDAVTSSLNAGPFDPALNAERRYQPAFDLADLAALKVSVVPKSVTISNATRTDGYFDCAVDIGVQKKITDDAEIDALVNLIEEIADHLRQKRLDDAPEAAFVSIANEPVFAPEHLDTQRVFTSVLTVTYRVRR
ncbi:MAG: hypothetical protein HBSAPP02_27460 [Phycisphaerae bacterium]|nr:MAG: hypothetical protein HRU71_01360 [Planctomycetia bacterium]GJQ27714.1 MAG: hypothetical protein HBSAPP02_27460 [Phycisphaerae bacterium]